MLLAIDISNTNIKFGLYNSVTMRHHWVVSTARQRTTDEYAMVLNDLALHAGHRLTDIDDIILIERRSPFDARLSGAGRALLQQRSHRSRSHA